VLDGICAPQELLTRLGGKDSRGVVGIYTMLTANKVFRPLIAEWCAAAVISKCVTAI
jgi:hypothetical protein